MRFHIKAGDTTFKEHLSKTVRNATDVSKTIQNELLSDMRQIIKQQVVHDVSNSGFWSVLADETTDAAKREQLVICVRFICRAHDKYIVCEEPIAIIDLIAQLKAGVEPESDDSGAVHEVPLNASNVANTIAEQLKSLKFDFHKLVTQVYDGASTMSGQQAGVAAIIRDQYRYAPMADYYHCAMHALNLSCSRAVSVSTVRHAQDIIAQTTSVFGSSAKRTDHFVTTVQTHAPIGTKSKLVSLCTTLIKPVSLALQAVEQIW